MTDELEGIRKDIDRLARSGYFDLDHARDWALDALAQVADDVVVGERLSLEHPQAIEMSAYAREAFAKQAAMEATWTARTRHDDLLDAADDLVARGIAVSFGLVLTEGAYDLYAHSESTNARAEVVFNVRDHEGKVPARATIETSTDVLREVVFVLAHHGISVDRDKTEAFVWQKRRSSIAPASGRTRAPADVPKPITPKVCAKCGGRGWITPTSASSFPTLCDCKR